MRSVFDKQIQFQKYVTKMEELPADSTRWYSYHMLAMVEEMGEILKSDKRWKTHRNENFEPEEKVEEIVDMFITMMNICIFSGVNVEGLLQATEKKIDENYKRVGVNVNHI